MIKTILKIYTATLFFNFSICMEENEIDIVEKIFMEAMVYKKEQKQKKYAELLKIAANSGHAIAQYELGKKYLNHAISHFKDFAEIISCDMTEAQIHFEYGKLYKAQNLIKEANLQFLKAEKLGYPPAKKELILYYLNLAKKFCELAHNNEKKEVIVELQMIKYYLISLKFLIILIYILKKTKGCKKNEKIILSYLFFYMPNICL
ncbi:hypothetical protein M1446_00205 [Candidatus Dependentiae bacterium]|nr:hypothetical protein [Candidatus Dependentiae bacterium]